MSWTGSALPTFWASGSGISTPVLATMAYLVVGSVGWAALEATRPDALPAVAPDFVPIDGATEQVMLALQAPRLIDDALGQSEIPSEVDDPVLIAPIKAVITLTSLNQDVPLLDKDLGHAPRTFLRTSVEEAIPPVEIVTVDPPSCVDRLRRFAADKSFQFGIGSARLPDAALPTLRQLGQMSMDCPEALIRVTGHSDSSGSDYINFSLSWARADGAVAALARLGVDISRFEPLGFGARAPLEQGDAGDDARNRRIAFEIIPSPEIRP